MWNIISGNRIHDEKFRVLVIRSYYNIKVYLASKKAPLEDVKC